MQPDPAQRAGADAAAVFDAERPRLVRIAYRMLGSFAEAEDVVQDAWLRWHGADRAAVRNPGAYLARTVTRLCLDALKSARARHETYIGPWLPEPFIEPEAVEPADDISLTLMLALERLSPLERAAFLLHDVFGMAFGDVAQAIGRDAGACRQLASRARDHVRAARPRFPVEKDHARTIADAFIAASRNGDVEALRAVLAEDAVAYTDGGGKSRAARNPLFGREHVARFFAGITRKFGTDAMPEPLYAGTISGLPGIVTIDSHGHLRTLAVAVEDGRVTAVYITLNPDKLGHVRAMLEGGAATTRH